MHISKMLRSCSVDLLIQDIPVLETMIFPLLRR